MPASAGRLGLQLFTMSLQQAEKGDGSDLLVDIKPFFPKSEDEEWQNEEVVILKNISDLRFAYFGLDEEGEVAQDEEESLSWQDEWLERQVLPKLVSIDIELSNGKIWPQIVVALKVNTTDAKGGGRQSPFGRQSGNPFGAR
jgi:general secretion pathway protein J